MASLRKRKLLLFQTTMTTVLGAWHAGAESLPVALKAMRAARGQPRNRLVSELLPVAKAVRGRGVTPPRACVATQQRPRWRMGSSARYQPSSPLSLRAAAA